MISTSGLSNGIGSTPIIPFLDGIYCGAEVPYRYLGIKRTLPTPCPPIPKGKKVRKIKRIVATAAASAVPVMLCDIL